MDEHWLQYYRQPGVMTDLTPLGDALGELPRDLPALVRLVQGVMLHVFWAEHEGFALDDARRAEVGLRPAADSLRRALALDPAPLAQPRPLARKVVGNCRHFSVLLCALLQRQGIPARARAGFGTYFLPDHYEDHWVAEYWHAARQRWVMVDAQLSPFQLEALRIAFDPLDVPPAQFWTAERAWLAARAGEIDPEQCGIFDMHGMDFIRGSLGLDFGALNKFEVLPWDGWGIFQREPDQIDADGWRFLDQLAAMMADADQHLPELQRLFQQDERVRPPQLAELP
ncbi:MAG: transglutaminase domain-containing protein [Anaerolineae bacterium]|nr:transglutaminase domain-containing protein [Anaerolineae bacterium]